MRFRATPASWRPPTGTFRSPSPAGSFARTCTSACPWSSSRCPRCGSRGEDILLIAKAFLRSCGIEHNKPGLTFAPDALRALSLHPWPGNVRELQNRVRRAVIMADGKRVTVRDLELTDTLSALPPQTLKEARETVEREMG